MAQFRSIGITLSGGSVVKRQNFSTLHLNMARFILGTAGLIDSHNLTQESFRLSNTMHKKNLIENFSKNKKIWLIREKIRFSPLVNEYWLICKLLFVISKNNPSAIDGILDNINVYEINQSLLSEMKMLASTNPQVPFLNIDTFSMPLDNWDLIHHPLEKRFKNSEEVDKEIENNKKLIKKYRVESSEILKALDKEKKKKKNIVIEGLKLLLKTNLAKPPERK